MTQTVVLPVLYFLSAFWFLFVSHVAFVFGVEGYFCLCVFFSIIEDFIVVVVYDLV